MPYTQEELWQKRFQMEEYQELRDLRLPREQRMTKEEKICNSKTGLMPIVLLHKQKIHSLNEYKESRHKISARLAHERVLWVQNLPEAERPTPQELEEETRLMTVWKDIIRHGEAKTHGSRGPISRERTSLAGATGKTTWFQEMAETTTPEAA